MKTLAAVLFETGKPLELVELVSKIIPKIRSKKINPATNRPATQIAFIKGFLDFRALNRFDPTNY